MQKSDPRGGRGKSDLLRALDEINAEDAPISLQESRARRRFVEQLIHEIVSLLVLGGLLFAAWRVFRPVVVRLVPSASTSVRPRARMHSRAVTSALLAAHASRCPVPVIGTREEVEKCL